MIGLGGSITLPQRGMIFRRTYMSAFVAPNQAPVPDALASDVAAAQQGDEAALRRVLDAVGPDVARVTRAILGRDAAERDDVVQESLLHFVKALAGFRGECSARRFARRIAARTAIAQSRRSRRNAADHESLDERVHALRALDPELSSLAARRQELLRELLATLPLAQAETLALRVVLGLSLAEVAVETNVPENTVRSRLRLAREALRERIEADPGLLELLGGSR